MKFYCVVTDVHVCEQLTQSYYMKVEQSGAECLNGESFKSKPLHHQDDGVAGVGFDCYIWQIQ